MHRVLSNLTGLTPAFRVERLFLQLHGHDMTLPEFCTSLKFARLSGNLNIHAKMLNLRGIWSYVFRSLVWYEHVLL
jgi:hypothetical protein